MEAQRGEAMTVTQRMCGGADLKARASGSNIHVIAFLSSLELVCYRPGLHRINLLGRSWGPSSEAPPPQHSKSSPQLPCLCLLLTFLQTYGEGSGLGGGDVPVPQGTCRS